MIRTMKNKYMIRSRILREEISFNSIICFYFAYARSFARSMDIESSKISKLLIFQKGRYVKSLSKLESNNKRM